MPSLAISDEDYRLIHLAATRRGLTIGEMAHVVIIAGLKTVAPEVLFA